MTNKNTFLLGLGNQKCGTTWLHRYLSQSSNFNSGFEKEYHIWDALDVPLFKKNLVGLRDKFVGSKQAKQRYKMQHHKELYFDYFCSLYTDDINLSADITPSYSALEVPRLQFIRNQFSKRGISTKAIILIRDPVSRIKSTVRFNLDRRNYREGIEYGETDFLQALRQYYKSDHCRQRTFYHEIIPKAFEVFREANVYIGIYESMFELAEIERLSQFCGVTVNSEYAKVYVNKTKNPVGKSVSLEAEIRMEYDDVYRYCNNNFQSTQNLWC